MEVTLFDGGKNENELLSSSTLQETESCDHFSIRKYVAQASERDPQACSPFKSGKPNPGFDFPVFSLKKFRRWDCDNCMSNLVNENSALIFSSDQSANNDKNDKTSCSISLLGTSLVPLSINCSGATVPVPVTEQDSNQDTQDNIPLSELTKSDARQLAQEQGRIKSQIESEKSKEIEEIMANTSRNNSDLIANPVSSKKLNVKMKMNRQKSRKVRSLAEIIGSDEPGPSRKVCKPDDDVDPTAEKEKEKEKEENSIATIACNNSDAIKEKLSIKLKKKEKEKEENSIAVIAYNNSGTIKEKLSIKNKKKEKEENSIATIAYNNSCATKEKLSIKNKKKYKTLSVVDETSSLMSWLKKTSKKIKKTDNKCVKRKNLEGETANLLGKQIADELEQGRIAGKEKEKESVNIGNIVRKKRTKKPRKCLQLQSSATVGEIDAKKMSFSVKSSKKLHRGAIGESSSDLNLSKVVKDKDEKKNSKRSGTEVQKVRKKKRKISEQKNSNDLSMDIVELLAKSLQDKHLTNEIQLNSNLNSNLDSNSSAAPQIKPGNEKLTNFFPCNKSPFNNYNNSGAGAWKTVQNPQIGQSSNHTIERFDLNRVIIEPNRVMPALNPPFGYSKQYTNNNYTYNLPPNSVSVVPLQPRNDSKNYTYNLPPTSVQARNDPNNYTYNLPPNPVRMVSVPTRNNSNNYTYNFPPNSVPVPTRNDSIPATHLLQLMDASNWSSSPNPNFAPIAQFRPLSTPLDLNNQQHLMRDYLHRDPCSTPLKPLPRLGVLGSLLQKEITSPKQNCGTQSGYRIGDLNLNCPPEIFPDGYIAINYMNNDNNVVNDGGNKGRFEEGVCVINRNPADFTEIDENNEYMRGGSEQNPRFVGGFCEISNGVVYRGNNNVGAEREFPNRRFMYNAVVH